MMSLPQLNVLLLDQYPILEQLRLEEALLRVDKRNWCLINQRPSQAIVMGISAQPEHVIDLSKLQQKPVSLIRRFSGGGTVFIDENCVMVTFICNQEDIGVPCFPKPVFQWSESFYRPIFKDYDFNLRENDYVMGHRKFGGNAQYMMKNRWLHHSSFLWDYDADKMEYLKLPPKTPEYRQQRPHREFLCKLNEYFSNRSELLEKLCNNLKSRFEIHSSDISVIYEISKKPHRKVSEEIMLNLECSDLLPLS